MTAENIVVTGATGHLGVNLVRALAERENVRIKAICHKNDGEQALRNLAVEKVKGSVVDFEFIAQQLQGAHTVYHLAALLSDRGDQPGRIQKVNVDGVDNICRSALAHQVKLIHVSSIRTFDLKSNNEVMIDESFPPSRETMNASYGATKVLGEQIIKDYVKQGLHAVILNPTGIIGPYDFLPSRMGQFFLDLYHGKFSALVQGGFDWVDVRDVVQAMMQAAQSGRKGENYLLSGTYSSMKGLAQLAHQWTGANVPRWYPPLWMVNAGISLVKFLRLGERARLDYETEGLQVLALDKMISSQKAKNELGFFPRELSQTIRDIYVWFLQAGFIEENPKLEKKLGIADD